MTAPQRPASNSDARKRAEAHTAEIDAPRPEITLGRDGVARYRTGVPVDLAARCAATSPESGQRCWLSSGHDHAHEGPHPTGYEGWRVTWGRVIPPGSSAS